MSFKKISGIVQIPIFIQLHYFSSGTALSQGSSEKFPIRSEKFSYILKKMSINAVDFPLSAAQIWLNFA